MPMTKQTRVIIAYPPFRLVKHQKELNLATDLRRMFEKNRESWLI